MMYNICMCPKTSAQFGSLVIIDFLTLISVMYFSFAKDNEVPKNYFVTTHEWHEHQWNWSIDKTYQEMKNFLQISRCSFKQSNTLSRRQIVLKNFILKQGNA